MSEQSIQQIQAEHGEKTGRIMNIYLDGLDEIRSTREPEAGAYLDRLSDEQRMTLLRAQLTERATEVHEDATKVYTAQVESYHRQLEERVQYIRGALFKCEDAGALSRAATATDVELGAMLEIAAQASNSELGRAVFVAAEQRGLGGLMNDYFSKLNPAGAALYQEWAEIPPEEILERQLDVDAILPTPDPDSLMPRARV